MSDFIDFNQFLGNAPIKLSKQQNNDFQKLVNDARKKAKQDMPLSACLLCGCPQHNCNSHSVPQRCLKNIAINLNKLINIIVFICFNLNSIKTS